jgi:hypothetical protein
MLLYHTTAAKAITKARAHCVMSTSYAVLMKVHYWDAFVERRLQHLMNRVAAGDIFVFVDETHGAVGQIAYRNVIRATENDMARLDVLLHPQGSLFWYNVDYPLYYFYLMNNKYDYYLMCEHDAVLNVDIDNFVGDACNGGIDYVAFPFSQSFSSWPWRYTCDGVYPAAFKLCNWLNSISLHSRASVEFLLKRRQVLARRYRAGEIVHWPFSEAFIPTEMLNNGFVVRHLGEFGKAAAYNWWPPHHENDLPSLRDQGFVHPVLDERRYVRSCLWRCGLRSFFSPGGQLRRLLKRSSEFSSKPTLINEFVLFTVMMRRLWRRGRRLFPEFIRLYAG